VSRPVVFLVVCFSAREFGCLMVKDDATVFESGPAPGNLPPDSCKFLAPLMPHCFEGFSCREAIAGAHSGMQESRAWPRVNRSDHRIPGPPGRPVRHSHRSQ
jgi:hypothetical protein